MLENDPQKAVRTLEELPSPASTRPELIYVLGDSHVMAFNHRLYARNGRHYLFESLYVPGVVAGSFAASDGAPAPAIAAALRRASLIVDAAGRAETAHRTHDPHWRHLALVEGTPRADPPLVLSVGGLDIMHFGVGLGDVDDIALPASRVEETGPLSGEPLPGALPFEDAVDRFAAQLAPLAGGLRDLRAAGFERVVLLSLAPPTSNDQAFRAARKNVKLQETASHATLGWRTKCAVVANAALARIAAEADTPFIDRWSDQVRGGYALPGLLIDWLHLSGWAADRTALAVIDHFANAHTAAAAPPAYFQMYVDDPGVANGIREFTVNQADFDALRDAPFDAFVAVRDVNERATTWVNRARIVRIAGT